MIRILSPLPRPPGPAPEDPNPRAVVAIVSSGAFDLLLSADAESEALLPLDLPDVEAMKVPHHGSSDPGLPEVLDRLRPEIAGALHARGPRPRRRDDLPDGPGRHGDPHREARSHARNDRALTRNTPTSALARWSGNGSFSGPIPYHLRAP